MHLYCGFSIRCQMAPQQTAKFRTTFLVIFYQLEEGQRHQLCIDLDAVFTDCQRTGCALLRTKRFVVPLVDGATRFVNLRRKFSKTQKNRELYIKYEMPIFHRSRNICGFNKLQQGSCDPNHASFLPINIKVCRYSFLHRKCTKFSAYSFIVSSN